MLILYSAIVFCIYCDFPLFVSFVFLLYVFFLLPLLQSQLERKGRRTFSCLTSHYYKKNASESIGPSYFPISDDILEKRKEIVLVL